MSSRWIGSGFAVKPYTPTAVERRGNTLNHFKEPRTGNGSSQNLALAGCAEFARHGPSRHDTLKLPDARAPVGALPLPSEKKTTYKGFMEVCLKMAQIVSRFWHDFLDLDRSPEIVLADYSQVDMRDLRYKFVNFGAERSPGSPDW